MTTPLLKIKVFPKTTIKGKMDVRFPAKVAVAEFLTVDNSNGIYTFGIDYTLIGQIPVSDPTTAMVAIYDETTLSFKLQSISSIIASAAAIDQHITTAGPVPVLPNAGIVRVDQVTGAPMTLNMPLASLKTCPVLLSDWKGDAGTNNITVNLTGSDKFPGGLTSWTIAADTGSLRLSPVSGVGYTIG